MYDRKCKRVYFVRPAEVTINDRCFEAMTADLSLNGLFIRTEHKVPVGERGGVSVKISDSSTIDALCVVVRSNEDGFAVQYKSLDFDSVYQIKKIIDRKPSYLLKEHFDSVGTKSAHPAQIH